MADKTETTPDPVDVIERALPASVYGGRIPAARAILAALHKAGFAVVRASALGGVIDDAEASVRDGCCVRDGTPHPALARRYERDMADINELRRELAHAQQS